MQEEPLRLGTAVITPKFFRTGALTLASTSNFQVDINGTAVGTGYDRSTWPEGAVKITGSNLMVTVGTTLSVGQTFTILNKISGGAVTGTFAGTPKGVPWWAATVPFSRSVTSEAMATTSCSRCQAPVPEPSTWMGGALAIAGLAFTQRRRLRKLIARRCAVGFLSGR